MQGSAKSVKILKGGQGYPWTAESARGFERGMQVSTDRGIGPDFLKEDADIHRQRNRFEFLRRDDCGKTKLGTDEFRHDHFHEHFQNENTLSTP